MLGIVTSGLRAAAGAAKAVVGGASSAARTVCEATGAAAATPLVHAWNMAHGSVTRALNLPGMAGAVQTVTLPSVPTVEPLASAGGDRLAGLTVPPPNS